MKLFDINVKRKFRMKDMLNGIREWRSAAVVPDQYTRARGGGGVTKGLRSEFSGSVATLFKIVNCCGMRCMLSKNI